MPNSTRQFSLALRQVLYGMAIHDQVRSLQRSRGSLEHLFVLISFGDLLGVPTHVLLVILAAIGGAAAAMALQKYVIIFSTAFGGAWTVIVGGLALAGDRVATRAAEKGNVWIAYPFNPAPAERWVIAAWLVLSVIGIVTQLRVTAQGKK